MLAERDKTLVKLMDGNAHAYRELCKEELVRDALRRDGFGPYLEAAAGRLEADIKAVMERLETDREGAIRYLRTFAAAPEGD